MSCIYIHTYAVAILTRFECVIRSNATYHRLYDAYNDSRAKLGDAEKRFEEGCNKYKNIQVAMASLNFIESIGA